MKRHSFLIIICLFCVSTFSFSQDKFPVIVEYESINTGAQNLDEVFFDTVTGYSVGIVTNRSVLVGNKVIVDYLLDKGVPLTKIFSPEHGFRGHAEAGEIISSEIDSVTGLPVVSLYGKHKMPTTEDLAGIDLMIFDLQDVGARFYTYISTLTYVMEACAENNIPIIVLDRPNPNGFYIDGPILEPEFTSFVGLHPIPIVHGMTMGEYALMVNGEAWLKNGITCKLQVVKLEGYSHNMTMELPIKPSPNLPNWESILLYPSLCLFEGTVMSIGRGTDYPFQIYGHPDFYLGSYTFTPQSMPGASLHPKFEDIPCYGQNLTGYAQNILKWKKNKTIDIGLDLNWLISSYQMLESKTDFFNAYFDTLAGTDKLRNQIEEGKKEEEIKASWRDGLEQFKTIRAKYLLYD